jgi:CGNR zinc finger
MALIEIPNAYTADMAVSTAGRGHFAVIGEPIVAVDPINTVAAPGSPAAEDLLPADRDAEAWWRIENARVPGGDLPDIRALRRLRRCANPACSMIFIAVNPRRSWCTPGVCGNRARVARHYQRAGGA